MKYLGEKNINKHNVQLKRITVLDGYDVYIPDSYINPISYLKKGCPLWVKKDSEGNYDVWRIENEKTWKRELFQIIESQLPSIKEPIIRNLSFDDNVIDNAYRSIIDIKLSGYIFNRSGDILSTIQTFNRELPNDIKEKLNNKDWEVLPTKEVVVMSVMGKNSIKDLMKFLLKRERIREYKGIVLWHNTAGSVDYSAELGFTPTEYGFSLFKIPQEQDNR